MSPGYYAPMTMACLSSSYGYTNVNLYVNGVLIGTSTSGSTVSTTISDGDTFYLQMLSLGITGHQTSAQVNIGGRVGTMQVVPA